VALGQTEAECFFAGFRAALTAGAVFAGLAGCLSFYRRGMFRARSAHVDHVVHKDS
jgi:hypothetical protein